VGASGDEAQGPELLRACLCAHSALMSSTELLEALIALHARFLSARDEGGCARVLDALQIWLSEHRPDVDAYTDSAAGPAQLHPFEQRLRSFIDGLPPPQTPAQIQQVLRLALISSSPSSYISSSCSVRNATINENHLSPLLPGGLDD
jgi:hypothetical protein